MQPTKPAAEIVSCPRCGIPTLRLYGTTRRKRPHRCPPRPTAPAAALVA